MPFLNPKTRLRKKPFTVDLIEFVRPGHRWPSPYTIEQMFEAFMAIAHTGIGSHRYDSVNAYGRTTIADLLSPNGADFHHIDPITSMADLRERYHYMLLAKAEGPGETAWREEHGIEIGKTFAVTRPTYRPFVGLPHLGFDCESDIQKAFVQMIERGQNTPMAYSLNQSHPDCRSLHGVKIHIRGDQRFAFVLSYGDFIEPSSLYSRWDERIAITRPGESFGETFARAYDAYNFLVFGIGRYDQTDLEDLLEHDSLNMRDFLTDQANKRETKAA